MLFNHFYGLRTRRLNVVLMKALQVQFIISTPISFRGFLSFVIFITIFCNPSPVVSRFRHVALESYYGIQRWFHPR